MISGWNERHDVIAAVEFLKREFPGQPIYIVRAFVGSGGGNLRGWGIAKRHCRILFGATLQRSPKALWGTGCETTFLRSSIGSPIAACAVRAPSFLPVNLNQVLALRSRKRNPPKACRLCLLRARKTGMPGWKTWLPCSIASNRTPSLWFLKGRRTSALDEADPQLYRDSLFNLLDQRQKKE